MGQKSNLLTLRKHSKSLDLNLLDSKAFLNINQFTNVFQLLLNFKGLILLKKSVQFFNNIYYLTLSIFYKTFKINVFKQKEYTLKKIQRVVTVSSSTILQKLLSLHFKKLNLNLVCIKLINSNLLVSKKLLIFFYSKLKRFINNLFVRRFNLYLDFLKLTTLICVDNIEASSYLYLLTQIFKNLSKKSHNNFMFFIKLLFKLIINLKSNILGLKLEINGRLKGKDRSSSVIIKEGRISTQTIDSNVKFAKSPVYTSLGAFGLKFWIAKKNI
jgi:hypothetical protein